MIAFGCYHFSNGVRYTNEGQQQAVKYAYIRAKKHVVGSRQHFHLKIPKSVIQRHRADKTKQSKKNKK